MITAAAGGILDQLHHRERGQHAERHVHEESLAIGFLFVPITTLAYLTVPPRLNDDASALFTMFRNVAGSIGISLSTAMVRERTQARMAHLSEFMSPLSQNGG
ncbi:hypothetical protein QFZ97_005931 [Paraburkholderia youngii]